MSDWQVGDLAVCVDTSPHWYTNIDCPPGLVEGKTYRVLRVCGCQRPGRKIPALVVTVDGIPCATERFRKIRPDELESCEDEFIQLLNRSKQRADAERYLKAVANG